jgi:hypothetical protein
LGVVVLGFGTIGRAQVVADGTLSPSEGYNLEATQTINTGFGDSTVGDGTSGGGSELDAAYGVISGGNLNIFLAGNFEDNGNHVNLFVDDGRVGQSVLALPGGDTMSTMNGSVFSPGFQATYALDANDYTGTTYVEEYTLTAPGMLSGGYVGAIGLTGGIGSGTPGVATIGWNDTHVSTMGTPNAATNQAAADAVTTGMEVSIPLSALGGTGGPFLVLADVNGGGDSYLSNQFLPGLPVGTGNVGGGGPFTGPSSGAFNFGATPGEYFVVSVPEPASMSLVGGAIMMLCARRRKA